MFKLLAAMVAPADSTIAYDPVFWFVGFTWDEDAIMIASEGKAWALSESSDWT